jgi:hypothetical protein
LNIVDCWLVVCSFVFFLRPLRPLSVLCANRLWVYSAMSLCWAMTEVFADVVGAEGVGADGTGHPEEALVEAGFEAGGAAFLGVDGVGVFHVFFWLFLFNLLQVSWLKRLRQARMSLTYVRMSST